MATDFKKESWLESLKQHGFDSDLPTFFLWEGVVYYLEEETVYATLDTVSEDCTSGSAIAFDYLSRGFLVSRLLAKSVAISYGEPLIFGISTDPPARKQVANFLKAHGSKFECYEPYGEESTKKKPFGGLVVAVSK